MRTSVGGLRVKQQATCYDGRPRIEAVSIRRSQARRLRAVRKVEPDRQPKWTFCPEIVSAAPLIS